MLNSTLIKIVLLSFALASCNSIIRFSQDKNFASQSVNNLPKPQIGLKIKGIASFYADKFEGKKTASGEIFSQQSLTAAHQTMPFGTILNVLNLNNSKSVIVRINDRGPFIAGRIIDLSKSAAEAIGMISEGTAEVEIEVIGFE